MRRDTKLHNHRLTIISKSKMLVMPRIPSRNNAGTSRSVFAVNQIRKEQVVQGSHLQTVKSYGQLGIKSFPTLNKVDSKVNRPTQLSTKSKKSNSKCSSQNLYSPPASITNTIKLVKNSRLSSFPLDSSTYPYSSSSKCLQKTVASPQISQLLKEKQHNPCPASPKRSRSCLTMKKSAVPLCSKEQSNTSVRIDSTKSIAYAKNANRRSKRSKYSSDQTSGRWTTEEHEAFLVGLKIFGREWKKVAHKIPTRTSAQIRSHAQKYFAKLARDQQHQKQQMSLSSPLMNIIGDTDYHNTLKRSNLSPSVRLRVQTILKDPKAAQREVEETLCKLRTRYMNLQMKLEQKHERKNDLVSHKFKSSQCEDTLANKITTDKICLNKPAVSPSRDCAPVALCKPKILSCCESKNAPSINDRQSIAPHDLGGALNQIVQK